MKICSLCKLEMDISLFNKDISTKDGLTRSCKICQKLYRKNNASLISKYREDNKDLKVEYNKKYREDNKQKIQEYRKKYREDNKDLIIQKDREYKKLNPEKIKDYRKKYYNINH